MTHIPKIYYPLLITLSILALFLLFWMRPQPVAQTMQPVCYLAKAIDNKVSIYQVGTETPWVTTQIDTRALPPADAMRLQQGVPLANQAEIDGFLQDFDS